MHTSVDQSDCRCNAGRLFISSNDGRTGSAQRNPGDALILRDTAGVSQLNLPGARNYRVSYFFGALAQAKKPRNIINDRIDILPGASVIGGF